MNGPAGPRSRALGALYGLAIGDALGMPTEAMPRAAIVARFGPLIEAFEPAPPDNRLAAGLAAGTVTDDTEQAMLLARLLIDGDGAIAAAEFASLLLAWEEDVRARGSLSLLGPSTKRAIAALLDGMPPGETGRSGTTNGAAMRIAPVGVATRAADLDLLTERVVAASHVTHNTSVALAGAAAVAAAVSAGLDGAGLPDAIQTAVAAAELAARRGHWVAAADVAARITWATGLVSGLDPAEAIDLIYRLVGTSLVTQESVPAAFAVLAASPGDPRSAARTARRRRSASPPGRRATPRGSAAPASPTTRAVPAPARCPDQAVIPAALHPCITWYFKFLFEETGAA
jgi:ADP-ribosylglycohydrolase